MPTPRTGAISFNDVHVEVGGTSGTTCSLNDTDIRSMLNRNHLTNPTQSLEDYRGAAVDFYIDATDIQIDLPSSIFDCDISMQYNGTAKLAAYLMIDITYGLNKLDYEVYTIVEYPDSTGSAIINGKYMKAFRTSTAGPVNSFGNRTINSLDGGNTSVVTGEVKYGGIGQINATVPHFVINNADMETGSSGLQNIWATYTTAYTGGTNGLNIATPNLTQKLADEGESDSDFDLTNDLNYVYGALNTFNYTPYYFYSGVPTGHDAQTQQRFKLMMLSDGTATNTTDTYSQIELQSNGEYVDLRIEFRPIAGNSSGSTTLKIRTPQTSTSRRLKAMSFHST